MKLPLLPLLLLLGVSAYLHEASSAKPAADLITFKKEIEPLLAKYCVQCHGPDKEKAELRVDQLDPDLFTGHDAELWEEVYNQLNIGDMPPEDEDQPTPEEREAISNWLHHQLRSAAEAARSTGGSNVLRRLTRYEYNNTLRDLLGIDIDFAKDLPPEGAAEEGFVNNSEVLGTSSLHIEYFQRIAANAIRKALALGDKPEPFVLEFEPELHIPKPIAPSANDKKKKKQPAGPVRNVLSADNAVLLTASTPAPKGSKKAAAGGSLIQISPREAIPIDGPIRITVRAAAQNASSGIVPRLHMELGFDGGNSASPFDVAASIDITDPERRDYVFDLRAERFPLKVISTKKSQFLKIRNIFNPGTADIPANKRPYLLVDSIRIEAPYFAEWPPASRAKVVGPAGLDAPAHAILEHFMARAYRRPPAKAEVDRMHGLYKTLRSRDATHEDALVDTLSAVLSSPGFLLLAEPAPAGSTPDTPRQLDNYELATRLSYFLWSTMPDDELFRLATKKKLTDPKVLAAQVTRMLDDPRCDEFTENFTTQWLHLDGIYSVGINPEFFPKFRDELKDTMIAETTAFFAALVKHNRSGLELIDSDVTMLNAELAMHYGIPGIAGNGLRPVKLDPASKRGGVLTHGSTLTLNSSGDDTHPIKRGVWILERILGDPPPPPPPAVPTLAEGDDSGERLSLKAKLEAHRQEDACMTCHRKIDPWGVAFENYDGVGVWRDSTEGDEPLLAKEEPASEPTATAPIGDSSFPKQKGVDAPILKIPAGATKRETGLYKAVNEALASMQRPYNHLRGLGSEGAVDQLHRFLEYIEIRTPVLEGAIDKLLAESGENRKAFMAAFRKEHSEVLSSNEDIRKKSAAIVAASPVKIVAKDKRNRKRASKTESKQVLRGAVDPGTALADGTPIADLDALKAYILEHKRDQFAETLVRKMMGYALGRHLDFTDTETVDTISSDFASNDFRLRTLIQSIILSDPFLTK